MPAFDRATVFWFPSTLMLPIWASREPGAAVFCRPVFLAVDKYSRRLLAKDPGNRFPGAEELLIALRDYLNRAA